MRDAFPGYYPPTVEEEAALWDDGLIVLDSSALLSLFRYSPQTRSDFLQLLSDKADQLWIPHHVGVEFHRNRLTVMKDQVKAFDEIEQALTESRTKIKAAILKFKRHPSLSSADLNKQLRKAVKKLRRSLAEAKAEHEAFVGGDDGHEKTFDAITALYDGRVGVRWESARLEALYKEGAVRFEKRLPPGFKDTIKGGDEQYGDLVIWRQILEHAKQPAKSVIFVTDDLKEDWWRIVEGRRISARVELIEEFALETGKRVHFYSPEHFLEVAKKRGAAIEEASLAEVEKVSQSTSLADKARAVKRLNESISQADFLLSMDRAIGEIDPERLALIKRALERERSKWSSTRIADIGRVYDDSLHRHPSYWSRLENSVAAEAIRHELDDLRIQHPSAYSKALADAIADAARNADDSEGDEDEPEADD